MEAERPFEHRMATLQEPGFPQNLTRPKPSTRSTRACRGRDVVIEAMSIEVP